jgi:acyl transferase domain-containing protein
MTPTTRVVVTGLGVVSPLGNDIDTFWRRLVAGESGVGPITRFDTSDYKVHIAAEVKDFDAEEFIDKRQVRRLDLFSRYAVAAAKLAGAPPPTPSSTPAPRRTGSGRWSAAASAACRRCTPRSTSFSPKARTA